jgi:hypothetical protein
VPEINSELLDIDLDNMTPLDAMTALYRLKKKARGDEDERE